ncbi:hypothetical protein E1N66_08720 [Pantoea allii]|nr:hypothetical protein E1N66_08720 [Pantoea allii]
MAMLCLSLCVQRLAQKLDIMAALTAWMKYVWAVQITNVLAAPHISWPEKPA